MGIADSFGSAFAKAQLAASNGLPLEGVVLITVIDSDKPTVTPIARRFHEMGFEIMATAGTAAYLRARGIPAQRVFKVHEGRPNCLDMIVNRDVQLLINTPMGKHAQLDDYLLRQAAIVNRVSYTTTMSAASAACDAILSLRSRRPRVQSLQEWQASISSLGDAASGDRSERVTGERRRFIHESAYVDEGAAIGAGTKIWHFCHVMPGAVIGERCSLGQNVVVMNGTRMGRTARSRTTCRSTRAWSSRTTCSAVRRWCSRTS